MATEKKTAERLLDSYLKMHAGIKGNRIVSDFSFNELVLLGMLYQKEDGGDYVTATEIGEKMKLLKSQLNKIITSLEKQGLIERERSKEDKRCIYLKLTDNGAKAYETEHGAIMELMLHITNSLGTDNTEKLAGLLFSAVKAVEDYK